MKPQVVMPYAAAPRVSESNSSPTQRWLPKCTSGSTTPGINVRPLRSIVFNASGAVSPSPTATIFSLSTATKPSIIFPAVTIFPFLKINSTCAKVHLQISQHISALFLLLCILNQKTIVHKFLQHGVIVKIFHTAALPFRRYDIAQHRRIGERNQDGSLSEIVV